MIGTLYGNQASKKFKANFYIKEYTSATTKPTSTTLALAAAEAISTFDGTAQVATYDFSLIDGVTTEVFVDGDYIVVPTPSQTYCVWINEAGIGTKPPAPSGATAYLPVTVATLSLGDPDVVGAAMAVALEATYECQASYDSTSDILTVTNIQGGAVSAASVNLSTATETVTTGTPGVGTWMKVGGIAEDYSIDPAPNEIKDSVGNIIINEETLTVDFALMNVTQRNVAILKTYKGSQVSICLMDKSNPSYPRVYVVDDITFNPSLNPVGDTATMPIKLGKTVEDTLTGTSFWDYLVDYV